MNVAKQSWEKYSEAELAGLRPILHELGFEIFSDQPLIGGERYLSSVKKLVLIGKRLKDNKKVIIKVSSDSFGQQEIEKERSSRQTLEKIDFAYHAFFTPEEILYVSKNNYLIFITAFIDQEISFLQRPLPEQFFLSLKLFALQEGAQAATFEHTKLISRHFGIWQATDYLNKLDEYIQAIRKYQPNDQKLARLLDQARDFLAANLKIIDLYSGFLTHWDLVPHNFRIQDNDIYLLDHSSLRFGNKYEGWARFINFMTLYNPELEKLLVDYVQKNRRSAEFLSLKLMRAFRLVELIWHYTKSLAEAVDQVRELNQKRISFWTEALEALLTNQTLSPDIIIAYQQERDALRDEAEKKRQAQIHQLF